MRWVAGDCSPNQVPGQIFGPIERTIVMSKLTIARGRWVICGADEDDVITDGAVVFEGDTIEAVGAWSELSAAHPDATVVGSDRVALMPGLINAHHHSAGSTGVQQGVPDLHLEPWLLARNRLRPQDVQLATLISAARLLASGVTTVVDVHSGGGTAAAYAEQVNRALEGYDLSGMRTAFTAGTSLQSHLISAPARTRSSSPVCRKSCAATRRPNCRHRAASTATTISASWTTWRVPMRIMPGSTSGTARPVRNG